MPVERSNEPEAFTAFERSGWDARIGGYERTFAHLTAQTVETMLDAARVAPGTRLLDVCTGHGVLAGAWRFDAPGDFLDAILQGAVRAKALLEAQDASVLATIRSVVAEGTTRFPHGRDGHEVPMPALVGSGAKPGPGRP